MLKQIGNWVNTLAGHQPEIDDNETASERELGAIIGNIVITAPGEQE